MLWNICLQSCETYESHDWVIWCRSHQISLSLSLSLSLSPSLSLSLSLTPPPLLFPLSVPHHSVFLCQSWSKSTTPSPHHYYPSTIPPPPPPPPLIYTRYVCWGGGGGGLVTCVTVTSRGKPKHSPTLDLLRCCWVPIIPSLLWTTENVEPSGRPGQTRWQRRDWD